MTRSPTLVRLATLTVVLLSAACSDATAPRSAPRPPGVKTPLVSNARPALDVVARELAVSLQDPAFRKTIRSAMLNSKRPEGRLILSEVVRLPGAAELRTRLQAAQMTGIRLDLDYECDEDGNMYCPDDGDGGGDGCELQCADDGEDCEAMCADREEDGAVEEYPVPLPPIEVYMPVEEHVQSWSGNEADALTLPQPDEEAASTVIAYDIYGNGVELPGGDEPPVIPVISVGYSEVVVEPAPVFTPPTRVDTRGVGVREFITTMRAENSHEPWWKGRPEFELLFAGSKDGGLEYAREMPIPSRMWNRGNRNKSWRGTPFPLHIETWDTTLGSRVKVECIEHDVSLFNFKLKVGGSTEKKVGPVNLNVEFAVDFEVGKNDDRCGSTYITVMLTDGTWGHIPSGPYDSQGTGDLFWYGYGLK